MENLTPISETTSVQRYQVTTRPTRSPGADRNGYDRLPPLVVPEEMPWQTMCRIFRAANPEELKHSPEYQDIRAYLVSYQKAGDHRRWDDFRLKIDPVLLGKWGDVLVECRRNGFVNPIAYQDMIRFAQIRATTGGLIKDLCTLCDRICHTRNFIDSGETKRMRQLNKDYSEPKKCWEE